MSSKTVIKLVRMMDEYLSNHPELFDYSTYTSPDSVIARLEVIFSAEYYYNEIPEPINDSIIHEASKRLLDLKWNVINDRIAKAGGKCFDNRDAIIIADQKITYEDMLKNANDTIGNTILRITKNNLAEKAPYILDKLSFVFCAENGDTRSINIFFASDNNLYLLSEKGYMGLFIYPKEYRITRYKILDANGFSRKLNGLQIYKWPKAFPAEYVPEKYLMGCDTGSWSLSYKEIGKKTTRHINGKGSFPDFSPYNDFLFILNKVDPNQNIKTWIRSYSKE